MGFYLIYFAVLCVACAALYYRNDLVFKKKSAVASRSRRSSEFKRFQRNYLLVYSLMAAADWLQGPYMYALYNSYGFSKGDIGFLFSAGFASSLVFGTIVASLADKFGRKKSCMLYAILYGIACLSKHFNNFHVLLFGRLLGGIASSILSSSFEAWMINTHNKKGFDASWLSDTFFLAVFSNSIIAIVCSLVAALVTSLFHSMVAPFDAAVLLLALGTVIIANTWEENYGAQNAVAFSLTSSSSSSSNSFSCGLHALTRDSKIIYLGIAQSLFEAAMFTFVFLWTPTLESLSLAISHGIVFACFMVCIMIGSSLFQAATIITSSEDRKKQKQMNVEDLLLVLLVVSMACMCVPIVFKSHIPVLVSFCIYEVCVGGFWPSVATLRGQYVPEEVRSTVSNFLKIPTNLFVLLVLRKIEALSTESAFAICAALLSIASLSQYFLRGAIKQEREALQQHQDQQHQQQSDDDILDTAASTTV